MATETSIISEITKDRDALLRSQSLNMNDYFAQEQSLVKKKRFRLDRHQGYALFQVENERAEGENSYFLHIILYFLLTSNRKLTLNLVSDYEVSKTRGVFIKMIRANPRCHEAYFALGKIYFHLHNFKGAQELLTKVTFERHDG